MTNEMGCFYKTVRLYKMITKKEVCAQAHVSRQYLTKIEDNLDFFSISKSMHEKLQRVLNIKLTQDSQLMNEFEELKQSFVACCLTAQEKQAAIHFSSLREHRNDYLNAVFFPYYLLMQFINNVLYDHHDLEMELIMPILDKVQMHFDIYHQQLYQLFLGIYHNNQNQLDMANIALLQAQSLTNDARFQSMICYYLGIVSLKLGSSLSALRYTMKARELFDSTCNYKRSIHCLSHLALVWMRLREYGGAIRLCKEAIAVCQSLEYPAALAENYQNLACISLQKGDYKEVVNYAQKAFNCGKNDAMLCFYAAFACWKLNLREQTARWINSGLNHGKDTQQLSAKLLKLLRKLNRDPEALEEILMAMATSTQRHSYVDTDILRLIYAELAELYKSRDAYEPAVIYYEKYLEL